MIGFGIKQWKLNTYMIDVCFYMYPIGTIIGPTFISWVVVPNNSETLNLSMIVYINFEQLVAKVVVYGRGSLLG